MKLCSSPVLEDPERKIHRGWGSLCHWGLGHQSAQDLLMFCSESVTLEQRFCCKHSPPDKLTMLIHVGFHGFHWWGTGTGCPEMRWMPCPWRHPGSGCMGLWAPWSNCRCPCSLQGSAFESLLTQTIPWFYDLQRYCRKLILLLVLRTVHL